VSLPPKPSLFIGSSVEGLDPAYTLQEALEYDCEPTVWPQGIFNPTRATLADLLQVARNTDFAAFIFTPDDVRTMRREDGRVPRDNVVFELGLMIGAIGPERCFFVAPGDERLQLPSDLIGLTPLTYVSKRRDENLLAALGPAANKIRRTIRECGPHRARDLAGPDAPSVEPRSETAEFARLWKGGICSRSEKFCAGRSPSTHRRMRRVKRQRLCGRPSPSWKALPMGCSRAGLMKRWRELNSRRRSMPSGSVLTPISRL
jgi:hypothetical protein